MYATADNSSLAVLQHESRVNQADFVGTEGNIVSVSEDKALRVFNSQGEMVGHVAHFYYSFSYFSLQMSLLDFSSLDTRIRDFSLVAPCLSEEEESQLQAVALATSNGKILVSVRRGLCTPGLIFAPGRESGCSGGERPRTRRRGFSLYTPVRRSAGLL